MFSHRSLGFGTLILVLLILAGFTVGAGTTIVLWSRGHEESEYVAVSKRQIPSDGMDPGGTLGQALICIPTNPCLSIVIDDVGRDLSLLRQLLDLNVDLTFSVLPDARYTKLSLKMLEKSGREIMLHLPMRPLYHKRITDEIVVLGIDDHPLETSIEDCLAKVPQAVGVNNHMGSSLSQDSKAVSRVLQHLHKHNLWFLDSRTTANSHFCRQAVNIGVKCLERDFFLDDPLSAVTIHSRFRQAENVARRRGWAVVIGHPSRILVRALTILIEQSRTRIYRLSSLVAAGDVT